MSASLPTPNPTYQGAIKVHRHGTPSVSVVDITGSTNYAQKKRSTGAHTLRDLCNPGQQKRSNVELRDHELLVLLN